MRKSFTIGIDPGFTRTGAVVLDEKGEVVNYITLSSDAKKYSAEETHHRADGIARELGIFAAGYPADKVCFAIERPIYNKNVKSFEKQWRLVQAILSILAYIMPEAMCCEVDNGTAKKALTGSGSANKDEMVLYSSFDPTRFGKDGKDVEALADAQGIALAARLSSMFAKHYPIVVHRQCADINVQL